MDNENRLEDKRKGSVNKEKAKFSGVISLAMGCPTPIIGGCVAGSGRKNRALRREGIINQESERNSINYKRDS